MAGRVAFYCFFSRKTYKTLAAKRPISDGGEAGRVAGKPLITARAGKAGLAT